jgi:hypothetical protein
MGFLLLSWQLLTQICLALSALILQVVAHGNPIEQLFYSLRNLQSEDNGNIAVLEMLTVLPEEVVDNQRIDSKINSLHISHYTQEVWELLLLIWSSQCHIYVLPFSNPEFPHAILFNSFCLIHLWFSSSCCGNLK